MNYAPFRPLPEDVERKRQARIREHQEYAGKIAGLVQRFGLVRLESDYMGRTTYYVAPRTGHIWCTHPWEVAIKRPSYREYQHIRQLNGIPDDHYYDQPHRLA